MSYDESMADRVRALLATRSDVTERKMFGGLCFMVAGHMCCGLTATDFMVRVGADGYERALAQPHARPMDFTGKPLVGMVYVSPAGTKTRADLAKWLKRAVAFVSTLPAKPSKAKEPTRTRAAGGRRR